MTYVNGKPAARGTQSVGQIFNHFTARSLWSDLIHGAALAFDPVPAKSRRLYARDDQAAFAADLAKLIMDRQAVVPPSTAPRIADIITAG